jgi:hypothetical protein
VNRSPCAEGAIGPSRWWWLLALAIGIGCRRGPQVGDHVLVEWRGAEYPAVIVAVETPSRFVVHYDGYSDDWNEEIPASRIRGRLSMTPVTGPAPRPGPIHVRDAGAAPEAGPRNVYREGERVRVEWHGSIYPATIIGVLGDDRYRVHYEGYGDEWDEDVGLNRILRKGR